MRGYYFILGLLANKRIASSLLVIIHSSVFPSLLCHVHRMALEKKDLEAIQLLLREEIRSELQPVHERFGEVFSNFDALFARDEKREQENQLRDEQTTRLEQRVETLEKKIA